MGTQVATTRPPLGPGAMAKYDYEFGAFDGLGFDDVTMDAALAWTLAFVQCWARTAADAETAGVSRVSKSASGGTQLARCCRGYWTLTSSDLPHGSVRRRASCTVPPGTQSMLTNPETEIKCRRRCRSLTAQCRRVGAGTQPVRSPRHDSDPPVGREPPAKPSRARLKEVQRIIEDTGVTTVFYERLVSPDVALKGADGCT